MHDDIENLTKESDIPGWADCVANPSGVSFCKKNINYCHREELRTHKLRRK